MASGTNALAGVGQDQFLQLLIAQLKNQDPLDPVSNQDFIQQLATLNTVSGIQSLNTNFSEMLKLQQITQGADLVGKTIEYTLTGEPAKTGKVTSVQAQDGKFLLQVGSDQVLLDQINSVK
ncbi:flagellar hook capping FlgD N-terminal domain-containing protein [Gemmata sp. JC717]|uniref:flagellar hook assembly protein FlgD n=1 Tax=Gemmata algarum TaxID=2975278 RepID=UPI0021BA8002|nr:flagellar hook capping FlgD N-terminal domain-containing protein [Gemmata algarum]MDY3551626.1 flagellar hook capping FlgD N-terminal domain-containing protein [Gemmata algarum]